MVRKQNSNNVKTSIRGFYWPLHTTQFSHFRSWGSSYLNRWFYLHWSPIHFFYFSANTRGSHGFRYQTTILLSVELLPGTHCVGILGQNHSSSGSSSFIKGDGPLTPYTGVFSANLLATPVPGCSKDPYLIGLDWKIANLQAHKAS